MNPTSDTIDILMYHSISLGPGPTCIAPEVFSAQVEALAEAGCTGISLDDYAAARLGQRLLPPRAVVLTFDDGFADFASEAAPLLIRRGWSATVFLPTGKLGGCDDWEPHDAAFPPRALMNWPQIEELASGGIDFGGHSVTHCDLTRLSAQALEAEVVGSQRAIEERIGRPASTFAVPFGKTAPCVQALIRKRFLAAVGTRFSRATPTADVYNLPRIEMWYFRDPRRWRAYLAGRAKAYVLIRRALRSVRGALSGAFN